MRWLLDTQLLIWAAGFAPDGRSRLSAAALDVITRDEDELLFSALAVLEVAIKTSQRKPWFLIDAARFRATLLDSDYAELPVAGSHAIAVQNLPFIHKDPFDRLLIAQATVEGVMLLTADATIARYPGPIRKV